MYDAEHASLAAELHQQLHEQVESLAEIEEALAAGHADEELLAVKQQLEEAIPALRDSLQELAQQQPNVESCEQEAIQLPEWLRSGAVCR
jgi:cell shape-determining protein MreC